MTHPIGKGIIDLIKKHEPNALHGDVQAQMRVLRDLGDSIAGMLAFVASHGEVEARLAALLVIDCITNGAPEIVRKARAEFAGRTK